MNKEKLVFELFKNEIKNEYMKTLKVGITTSPKRNVNGKVREYCKKIGANYVNVQTMINNYKTEIRLNEYSKIVDNGDVHSKMTVNEKIRHSQLTRSNLESKKIIDRNEGEND